MSKIGSFSCKLPKSGKELFFVMATDHVLTRSYGHVFRYQFPKDIKPLVDKSEREHLGDSFGNSCSTTVDTQSLKIIVYQGIQLSTHNGPGHSGFHLRNPDQKQGETAKHDMGPDAIILGVITPAWEIRLTLACGRPAQPP